MPAPALRLKEPTFRDGIAKYVATTCRLHGVPGQDVEDLTQETLTTIFIRISAFRVEDGDFEQWSKGVAVNVIRNHLRNLKRYLHRFSGYYPNVDDYAASDPSPERCARQNQARCAIVNAAKGISSQQAKVIVLHAVDGLSHVEIGNELCISEAMSQKDYQRARNHFAACISSEAFSVMPPSLTSCDPSSNKSFSFNDLGSRWTERSHYAGQLVASIVALLLFVPSCFDPQIRETKSDETQDLGPIQNAALYRSDEHVDVHDEPKVLRDVPNVKPEPASLPSVRDVSTPSKVVDKRPPVPEYVPRLSHKHEPSTSDHRPLGQ